MLLEDARNFLREKGLKELTTTSKMPDKVAMNFELPPGNSGQALLAATKTFLTRKGFQVRKVDHLTTAGGFTIFVAAKRACPLLPGGSSKFMATLSGILEVVASSFSPFSRKKIPGIIQEQGLTLIKEQTFGGCREW